MNLQIPLSKDYGLPTMKWLHINITASEGNCMDFLRDYGILRRPLNCNECGHGNLKLVDDGRCTNFRCTSAPCRKRWSLLSGTIFYNSH